MFSLCQLVAAPALGDLSDRYGRRPVLIFSLAGTVVSFVMLALAHCIAMLFLARIVDGLSGGNISTARAYVADVTEPKDRARAYGLIGAAFGLGFIFGPALSGVLARISYTAPIWAAAGTDARRDGDGVALAARNRAPRARRAPAIRSRTCTELLRRPGRAAACSSIDFVYWFAFAIFQTTFALFVARRFGFDVAEDRLFLRGVRRARRDHPGRLHPADRAARLGDKPTFMLGLVFGAVGLVAAALAHSVALFALALVPLAFGIGFGHPTMSSLVSRSPRGDEQGRVQGAASAVESLGRDDRPGVGQRDRSQRFGE